MSGKGIEMNRLIARWVAVLIVLAGLAGRMLIADELRAGAAVIDVSPRILPAIKNGGFTEATADRVLDPLYARCLALAAGDQTLVLAIVDSCMIPRELCDQIKQQVSQQTGVPANNLLIAATHTQRV